MGHACYWGGMTRIHLEADTFHTYTSLQTHHMSSQTAGPPCPVPPPFALIMLACIFDATDYYTHRARTQPAVLSGMQWSKERLSIAVSRLHHHIHHLTYRRSATTLPPQTTAAATPAATVNLARADPSLALSMLVLLLPFSFAACRTPALDAALSLDDEAADDGVTVITVTLSAAVVGKFEERKGLAVLVLPSTVAFELDKVEEDVTTCPPDDRLPVEMFIPLASVSFVDDDVDAPLTLATVALLFRPGAKTNVSAR